MVLIAGFGMFVGWVMSDVLEEQLIGKVRRERSRAVKAAARRERARTPAVSRPVLPHAVARPRSVVAPRSGP